MYPDGRLAQVVFWSQNEQAKYLSRLGLDVCQEDGHLVVRRREMTVGISEAGDPINKAAQFGMALFGMYWPWVVPGLLDEVNREWTRRRKTGQERGETYEQED